MRIVTLVALALVLAVTPSCGKTSSGSNPVLPFISSVTPASGGLGGGTEITIEGTGLANQSLGSTTVLFGGAPATDVIVVNDNEITCKTPSKGVPGPVDVTVEKNDGADILAGGFTYYPPPVLDMVDPPEGTKDGGILISLTGDGFVANDPGTVVVKFGGKASVAINIIDDSHIDAVLPPSFFEKSVDVEVCTNNGIAKIPNGFQYKGPLPTITSITPDSGLITGGLGVEIKGDFFSATAAPYVVAIGGNPCGGVLVVDEQTITCTTPPGQVGAKDVTVTNNNGTATLTDGFTYFAPPPLVIAVTPPEGLPEGGYSVMVAGLNFTAPNAGANTVTFGGNPATNVVTMNDSTIMCTVPAGTPGVAVDVTVTNNNGVGTAPGAFFYKYRCQWVDPVSAGHTNVGMSDDLVVSVSLPFTFPYRGASYTTCAMDDNGVVYFDQIPSFGDFSPSCTSGTTSLQNSDMVSLHWGDQDGSLAAAYKFTSASETILTWYNYKDWFGSGTENFDFQLHLFPDGTFCFAFKKVDAGFNGPYWVGVGEKGASSCNTVDWASGSVVVPANAARYESMSTWDLQDKVLEFTPSGGGFTTKVYPSS